jgi:hypothetical protein
VVLDVFVVYWLGAGVWMFLEPPRTLPIQYDLVLSMLLGGVLLPVRVGSRIYYWFKRKFR